MRDSRHKKIESLERRGSAMNIYSFVNSKDIGEYLRKIEYKFSSLEASWLIYMCRRLSYEEKKAAWKEVIASMEDCEIPMRCHSTRWKSLYEFLKDYMERMDRLIAEFYEDNPENRSVYMYSFLYKSDYRQSEEYETIFSSYEECLKSYKKDVADLDEDLEDADTGVMCYRFKKQSLGNSKNVEEIKYRGDGQVMDVTRYTDLNNEEESIFDIFEGMWFDFPTPFKKGDIVWVPEDAHCIQWECDGPFVLEGLSTWNPNPYVVESGDSSDMNGHGYFLNPNGTIYHEVMCNYMDLEYYPGPFTENKKILPALGKFLKGEIAVDFLLCVYRRVLLEIAADDIMLKSWYSQSMLEDVGLIE